MPGWPASLCCVSRTEAITRSGCKLHSGSRTLPAKYILYFVPPCLFSAVMLQIIAMTTALRRKLSALRNLTEDRGATHGEAAAALAAIGRLLARLGDAAEELTERAPPYVQPTRQRRGRRRTAQPKRPSRIRIGDIVDAQGFEGLWRVCKCGGDRFEVIEGGDLAPAFLRCCQCTRSRAMRPEHFARNGRRVG